MLHCTIAPTPRLRSNLINRLSKFITPRVLAPTEGFACPIKVLLTEAGKSGPAR